MKNIAIIIFLVIGSLKSWGQTLVVNPQNNTTEGGEIKLMNSDAQYNPWHIDNYAGNLRFFHTGQTHFWMRPDGSIAELAVDELNTSSKLRLVKSSTSVGNDWLFEIYRNTGLGSSDRRGNGMYFRDANSIQAGIVASRVKSSSDYRSDLIFYTNSSVSGTDVDLSLSEKMRITSDGKVGIGTTDFNGGHKLRVEGSIGAREIKVEASGWSDFVFETGYELRTLEEVEQHINENGHLPQIPSEAEVTENGINLGEMNAKLLQKIEELTLYMIDMNKRMNQIESENMELKEKVQSLEN